MARKFVKLVPDQEHLSHYGRYNGIIRRKSNTGLQTSYTSSSHQAGKTKLFQDSTRFLGWFVGFTFVGFKNLKVQFWLAMVSAHTQFTINCLTINEGKYKVTSNLD